VGRMLRIRHADIADLEKLNELDCHITWENMKKCITDGRVYVVTVEKTIIGWLRYGLLYDSNPFLNMLFLFEQYRGMGLGNKLMDEWETEMRRLGHNIVFTSTQEDETAQHFYRKRGYEDIGEFSLPGQDARELMLMKNIGG
jgi:GNAT superfamily N-acetyltransferase